MTPALNPADLPSGPVNFFGGVAVPFNPFNLDGPTLSIEQWSLAARFSASLISDLSANWSIGITHNQFDAGGQLTITEIVTLDPLVFNSTNIPYASPDNEIGYRLGFGFAWKFNDRFSADIGYQRHDTQVVDIESIALQFILSL